MEREQRERIDLGAYLDGTVYPALFAGLDAAFPDFGWTRKGGDWTASRWPPSFPYPVEHEKPDRLMVYANRPHWIKVHGHGGVRFLDLVNGGRKPDGLEFVKAVRTLCELAAVPFPERVSTPAELEALHKREDRRSVLEAVIEQAQETLWSARGEAARRYLGERGFTDANLRELELGLYLSVDEVRRSLGKDAELLKAAEDAAVLWPKLEGYIVIPWRDEHGRPLTLYGRWQTKTPPDGRPKTIALPGEGTKASPLYFDRARRAGLRDVVLVEGVFDAALLQARGDARVVASVAAQLSGLQVETLVRCRVRSVFICGDPDGGGDRGTLANIETLTKAGIPSFVVPRLPDELDPDEFLLRVGLDAWKAHVLKAVPAAVFRGRQLLGDVTPTSPDAVRREAVEKVLALVADLRGSRAVLDHEDLLRDAVERTGYTLETLEELAVDETERRQREALEREARHALQEGLRNLETKGNVSDVVAKTREGLAALEARTLDTPPPFSVDRLNAETKALAAGKLSGWETLDEHGLRFSPGELAVVGARTGHGKTSFLVGLLANWLRTPDPDELFVLYSAEEPEVRVYHRLLAVLAYELKRSGDVGWTANEVRDYLRDPESRGSSYAWPSPDLLNAAKDRLRQLEDRLLVVYRPSWAVDELEAHAQELARERKLGAVLVDYLQRVPPPRGSYDRRDIEVSLVGRRLKALAVAVSAPLVVGAQINRAAVQEAGTKIPLGKDYGDEAVQKAIRGRRQKLHHLREGGSEQEADLVLGLLNYRADFETDEDEERTGRKGPPDVTRLEVGILKSRYGDVGRWTSLAFEGRYHVIREPFPREL